MSQPTPYTPTTDFSQQEANNASGRSTVNTSALDAEFSNIETTLDQVVENIQLIQRDDGKLGDVLVEVRCLAPDVLNIMGGFNLTGLWATATEYEVNDIASNGEYTYVCKTAHTSGASFDEQYWIQFGFTAGADAAQAAASAQVSAANALSSENDAEVAAIAAAASATSASGSATSASGSAGTATAQASAASVYATAASNSAAAAAASAAMVDVAASTHAAAGKATPIDADEIPLADSVASFALKKLSWANIRATLKAYFDTIYTLLPSQTGNAGKLLRTNGTSVSWDGALTLGTPVTVAGTAVDFTGIPIWVKRITVTISGVSTNGSAGLQIQIGAGSVDVTGYIGSSGTNANSSAFTLNGGASASATAYSGTCILTNASGNTWVQFGTLGRTDGAGTLVSGGSKTLSGTLDRVRINTSNGTDTFDAGSVNIIYEG